MTNSRSEGTAWFPTALGTGAVIWTVILAAGCHRAAPATTPSPPRGSLAALSERVDSALDASGLEASTWGVLARSLDRGDTLYARGASSLLVPASSLKIVTLAVAAERLGWDFAYDTRLSGSGVIEDGVLSGDLVVTGSGDPSIDNWDGLATLLFQSWSERLKELGIRAVAGRLVCDDDAFDETAFGAGWAWDDLSASYAAGVGALQFNQNTVRLAVTPATAVGQPAHVDVNPPVHDLTLRALVTTGPHGDLPAVSIFRMPDSATLEISGTVPLGSPVVFRNASVRNPTVYFGRALSGALAADGIAIRDEVVDIDAIDDAPARGQRVSFVEHRSAPLSALAATMMKYSQNLYAETILKTLGLVEHPGGPEPRGSFAAGLRVAAATAASWGVPEGTLRMADGSGLSRYNLATPEALVAVLAYVYTDDDLRAPFHAALPVAGREGTLERRLTGTAADGNARAKTGSMSHVRTLAGFVTSADGEPLAFAILANNVVDSGAAEAAIDAIVVALAEFSRQP